jgi:hypothetical protein
MAVSDPYGRPTEGVGFGRGRQAVAGSQYFDDLETALKLLASADSQRSTTNSTAGEAMRFYNMFRDSRLSERPDVVDTQRLIDRYNARPEVRQGPPLSFAGEYLGGASQPYFPEDVLLNKALRAYYPGDVLSNEVVKYPDNDTPSFSVTSIGPKFGTNVEVSPAQYEQARLSSRAGLPLMLELQLLLDRFASPNFRVGSTVQGVADVIPAPALRNLDAINFVDPEGNQMFLSGTAAGYQSDRDIYLPIDSNLQDQQRNALERFLGLGNNSFAHTLRHEIGHSLDYTGFPSASTFGKPSYLSYSKPEYTQAINDDAALLELQSSVDWDMPFRKGLGGEYSPYVTAYGATAIWEDFSERMAMYLTDKEQGWIARDGDRKYRFSELFPESARYFDDILSRG